MGTNSIPFRWLGSHGVFNVGGSALFLTRYRAYDASLGRFLSADPSGLEGGPNLYAYCMGNPLAYIDPLGLGAEATWLDWVQGGLDAVGVFDPTGISDAINALIYLGQGEYAYAAISAVAIVPYVGDLGKAGKYGAKAIAHADEVVSMAKPTTTVLSDVSVISHGKVIGQGDVYLRPTIEGIESGKISPRNIFENRPLPGNSTPELPVKPPGYYHEYVQPTPGVNGAGPQRIVRGAGGELYYTPDHYTTFVPLN